MYVFQRIGDAGNIASEQINTFGQRLINMQNAINRMYERAEIVREDPALLVRPRRAW
ncbi:hypothetical protein EDF60_1673 [Leucobacter luti]|nr:hypothetical protein [Leucobacter luti]TCK41247.1 hypothetical protein EDF60_1673 [Leucobacter luti]